MDTVRRAVLACTGAMAVVAMAVIGLMMLTICLDVVLRFALSAPTDWAYPLNAAGVLVSTTLAIPHLYATGHHISMDLLHRALSPRCAASPTWSSHWPRRSSGSCWPSPRAGRRSWPSTVA